jgi:MFS family permease
MTLDRLASGEQASARWTMTALALTILQASLGTSIANVSLPTLAQSLGSTFGQVQWVVVAYLLATTALIVGAGRLGDVFGRRRMLVVGLATFSVASAMCSLSPDLWWLIAARGAQGLGAALMLSLGLALVADALPEERTGRAMGLLGAMSAVGTALGPSLGGLLIATIGWRGLFAAGVPLALLTIPVVWRHLPPDHPSSSPGRGTLDAAGTALLAGTLAAYSLALTLGDGFGARNGALLAVAGLGLVAFLRVESRAAAPLIRLDLFTDPVLCAGFAMNALVTTVVMATLVVGPFYLTAALALDPATVGAVMSAGPVVVALAGVPAGRLVEKFGAQAMTLVGLGMAGVGAALLSFIPAAGGVPGYIGPLAVLTAGYALFQAANNTAVMRAAGEAQRGVVSAVLGLSRNLGLITGASAIGAIFATASQSGIQAGLHITFAVAAGLVGLAFATALVSGRKAFHDVAQPIP